MSRDTSTVVKAQSPAAFLALVPHLVGFHPENSLVLVGFAGGRTGGAMRADLPRGHDDEARDRVATSLVGMMCRLPELDALTVVIYCDTPFGAGDGMPYTGLADALFSAIERAGFEVNDAFCVAGNGWASYFDSARPAGGYPLIELDDAAGTLPDALPGNIESPASRAAIPEVSDELIGQVNDALAELIDEAVERDRRTEGDDPARIIVEDARRIALVEELIEDGAEAASAQRLAELAGTVLLPCDRDAAMLQAAFGPQIGEMVIDSNRGWRVRQAESGTDLDATVAEAMRAGGLDTREEMLADLMGGRCRTRPDPERIERAICVLMLVVAVSPVALRPAPLCMLGWLNWALGRSSCAGEFVDAALSIDPQYGLARLIATMLDAGHLPEWAFAG